MTSAWIPVTERLPDDDLTVLVAYIPVDASEADVWIGYLDADEWISADGVPINVTHWMDLPEPPARKEPT